MQRIINYIQIELERVDELMQTAIENLIDRAVIEHGEEPLHFGNGDHVDPQQVYTSPIHDGTVAGYTALVLTLAA
jgi:hypothetical protein